MSLDLKFVQKGLNNKGFKKEKGKKHHNYYRFYINNGEIQTIIRSKIGGHSKKKYKTLKNSIIERIYKSLYFDNKNQFIDFLECLFELGDYQRMVYRKLRNIRN